jgi:citrate synthase
MREGVLFEITKEDLETGLRGVPVGYCTTSFVDPQKGLTYVGRPIAEVAHRPPIEVLYLLYYGAAGSKPQIDRFQKELEERAFCKPETLRCIEQLPRQGKPTDLFAAALLLAAGYEGTGDYREDCLNAIARLPQIAATLINCHAGWGVTPPSRPDLGYIENFVHMLKFPGERQPELIEVMKIFNVVHYDHCGGNLSTFVGKAVASGLEPLWGSLAAAMVALAGPRHGGANQETLEFLLRLREQLGTHPTEKDVEQVLRERVSKKQLIFGFGHAVLKVEDPRATVFFNYAQKHFSAHPLVQLALHLRTAGTKVLKEDPKISDPYPNIDAITGAILTAAGFPYSDYYTVLFGMARCVGIAIQIVYERLEARGGKGTPIIRPLYLYRSRH